MNGGSGGAGCGGSGGGGGGGNNLDDDGAQKGYLTGPLNSSTICNGDNGGLRVAEFHLADRKEGGLFGGRCGPVPGALNRR